MGGGCVVLAIGLANGPSLALFDRLGFSKVSECPYFEEVTLQYHVNSSVKAALEVDFKSRRGATHVYARQDVSD